jgi:hypothetical protein
LSVPCASEGNWSFHGGFSGSSSGPYCDGSFDTNNGIDPNDDVNFYAPQALGPGSPNTWYFGTDKLYRSADRADNAVAVSQLLETDFAPISAIAIAPQDDNVRVVGLNDGRVFATGTGGTILAQVAGVGSGTPGTPATGVGRIAIDPNNKNVAYVCFNGFGTPTSPIAHVWKTTNLAAADGVKFIPVSAGLPDVPVNAIAIDPVTFSTPCGSSDVYVGTDVGVFYSPDGGSSWSAYGSGFPHAAVFGLEIQNPSRVIRAATHGRGLYETNTVSTIAPTPTPVPTPTPPPPAYGEIISPLPCGPLASSSVAFSWTAGNANAYLLTVGTSPGGTQIFNSGQTAAHSATVGHLPTDGSAIYVHLWSLISGTWSSPPDYIYTALPLNVSPPIFAPASGKYKKKVTVNVASATSGATIYYTLDGTTPTASSPKFLAPFVLTQTKTVRAIATKTGVPDSPVSAATYTITRR